jgi:hypothetical protein
MLNTAEILKVTRPEKLFTGDPSGIKKQFHDLAKRFHPDTPTGSQAAFQRVNELYHQALKRISDGTWGEDGIFQVDLADGRKWPIKSLVDRPFELGHVYIGDDHITWLVDEPNAHFLANFLAKTSGFDYASARMREQMEPYLPNLLDVQHLKDGRQLLKVFKRQTLLNLKDVLSYFNGRIPGKHTLWITTALMNMACYLKFSKVSHQDISIDTVFIDPGQHTVALLGGWWYAKSFGETVENVPVRTLDLAPFRLKNSKKAINLTDPELIRGIGREILGAELKAPDAIEKWYKSIASKDAYDDYSDWIKARNTIKRKFIELHLNAEMLYK